MDKGVIALMIPMLALVIGLAATITSGMIKLQKERNKGRLGVGGDEVLGRVEALEEEVGTLRRQLSEAQERIDFAERLLARGREGGSGAAR